MAREYVQTRFDAARRTPASRWIAESPLVFSKEQNAGTNGPALPNGNRVSTRKLDTLQSQWGMLNAAGDIPLFEGIAWAAGDTLEIVAVIQMDDIASLSANRRMGIGLGTHGTAQSHALDQTAAQGIERIFVGTDSAGALKAITEDGATATVTDLGITYAAGTRIRVYIRWKKGTDVFVQVDNAAGTTIAVTLPSKLHGFYLVKGLSGVNGQAHCYGGYYRILTG